MTDNHPPDKPASSESDDESEQARIEAERQAREAEELASFERRAAWWSGHVGDTPADEVAARTREAMEQADRLAPEPDPEPAEHDEADEPKADEPKDDKPEA